MTFSDFYFLLYTFEMPGKWNIKKEVESDFLFTYTFQCIENNNSRAISIQASYLQLFQHFFSHGISA